MSQATESGAAVAFAARCPKMSEPTRTFVLPDAIYPRHAQHISAQRKHKHIETVLTPQKLRNSKPKLAYRQLEVV